MESLVSYSAAIFFGWVGGRDTGPYIMELKKESCRQQKVSKVIEFIEWKYKALESEKGPDCVATKDFCLAFWDLISNWIQFETLHGTWNGEVWNAFIPFFQDSPQL